MNTDLLFYCVIAFVAITSSVANVDCGKNKDGETALMVSPSSFSNKDFSEDPPIKLGMRKVNDSETPLLHKVA